MDAVAAAVVAGDNDEMMIMVKFRLNQSFSPQISYHIYSPEPRRSV